MSDFKKVHLFLKPRGKDLISSEVSLNFMINFISNWNYWLNLEVSVEWDEGDPQIIKFGLNEDGRGMELSELISFEHGILTCDDITDQAPHQGVILDDGNGTVPKGGHFYSCIDCI